jgi:phosphatidate phosphatase PAH1
MRKPELFKMACLRDILRLFPSGTQEAFYAGFGNRITDAMSYRSVGIPASKIYTIDSTGVVKTELLQAAGHKGSYIPPNKADIRTTSSMKYSLQSAPSSNPNTPTLITGDLPYLMSLCLI